MALHLPDGSLKIRSGLERYRDANQVPTSPLADDMATWAGSGMPLARLFISKQLTGLLKL